MNHPFVLRKRNYQWTGGSLTISLPTWVSLPLALKCLSLVVLVPGDDLTQTLHVALPRVHPQITVGPCCPVPLQNHHPAHLWKSTNLVKPPKPIHGNLWRGGCALLALHPESVLLFLFVGFQAWVHLQNRVLVSFKHQLPDCLVHKQLGLYKMELVLLHICVMWLHSRFVMQHQAWWAEPLLQCWSILACIHLRMSQWIIYIVMVCLLRELHALRQLPLVDQWPCSSDWRDVWHGVKMSLEALENIEDTSKVDNISEMPYSLRKSPLAKSTAPTIGRLREITWVNSDTAYKGDIPYHPRLPRTSPSRSRRTFSSGSSRFGRRATPGWLFSPPAWVTKSWLPPFFTWKYTAPSPPQPACPPGLERLLHWACWRSRT